MHKYQVMFRRPLVIQLEEADHCIQGSVCNMYQLQKSFCGIHSLQGNATFHSEFYALPFPD